MTESQWDLDLVFADGLRAPVFPFRGVPAGRSLEEGEAITFQLTGTGFDPFAAVLLINDEELLGRVTRDGGGYAVSWVWKPDFQAGFARVELRTGAGPVRVHDDLVIDPERTKLSRGDYLAMIGDILTDTAALAARAGCRARVARGGRAVGIARLELIRSRLPRIEKAVREINENPWRDLTREVRPTPLGRAGRVSPAAFRRAVGTAAPVGSAADRLPPQARKLAERLGQRMPRLVGVGKPVVNHRRREHANILAALLSMQSFLNRVREGIARLPRHERRPEHPRLDALARRLVSRVRRLLRLPLFESIKPSRGPIPPSHLFRRVPQYRRFYTAWQDIRRGMGDAEGDFLKVPVHRTYELYQLWCFLRLARAAEAASGAVGRWAAALREVEVSTAEGLALRFEECPPLEFDGFTLRYHPTYSEIWRNPAPPFGSFSRKMIPDIAVEAPDSSPPGAAPPSANPPKPVIVLDAKYRVDQQLGAAISSLHQYRDALVDAGATGPFPARLIRLAFVLCPRGPRGHSLSGDWQAADSSSVFFREEYRSRFRFGAIVLAPGTPLAAASALLDTLRIQLAAVEAEIVSQGCEE